MNFKKFISGASALTIAASAFAAMAVTVNAAAAEYGTYSDGSTLGALLTSDTAGTAAAYTADATNGRVATTAASYIELDTAKDYTITFSIKGISAAGTTLSLLDASEQTVVSSNTFTWNDPVATITINVNNTDATAPSTVEQAGQNAGTNTAVDASAAVKYIKFNDGVRLYYGVNISDPNQAYAVTFAETNSVAATVTIGGNDVTNGTTLPNGTYSYTATAAGYQDYTGSITVNGAAVNETFTMTAKTAAGSITVNYVDSADNSVALQTAAVLTGSYEGDSVTYTAPAYIVYNNELYKKDNNTYKVTTTLPATGNDGTVDLTYTKQNVGTFVYAEMPDTREPYADSANHSNGKNYNIGSTRTEVLTVPADGVYTFYYLTGGSTGGNTSWTDIFTVNDDTETAVAVVNYARANTGEKTLAGVRLHAGDVLYVRGSDSRMCLDYLTIVKTGELVETKAFAFDTIDMADYDGTVTVTVNGVSKSGDLPAEIVAYQGAINLAIIITDIPEDATVTTVLR